MNRILYMIVFITTTSFCFSQARIQGQVISEEGKPLGFSNVELYQAEKFIQGTSTDREGRYLFENVETGVYQLNVTYVGYTPNSQEVVISDTQEILLVSSLKEGINLTVCEIVAYKCCTIIGCTWTCGSTISSEAEIEQIDSTQLSEDRDLNIEVEPTLVHVFPNPTSGSFNVQTYGLENDVVIYDATGRVMLSRQGLSAGKYLYDLSHLPSGLYPVVIISDGEKKIRKLALQKM